MNDETYDYRIAVEHPTGRVARLALVTRDLAQARETLQEMLDDPTSAFHKGWIERRPLDAWRAFGVAQQSREKVEP